MNETNSSLRPAATGAPGGLAVLTIAIWAPSAEGPSATTDMEHSEATASFDVVRIVARGDSTTAAAHEIRREIAPYIGIVWL